ncbi:MAG TPA: DUF4410 domain-containing protein [Geobacteraceae bacterium]|nr:DUF4410 domain-containing protein [Geobacteraceae bacterium]
MVKLISINRQTMILIAALLLSFPYSTTSRAGELLKKVTGEVKVHTETDESRQPTSIPAIIYIQDFDLECNGASQDSDRQGRPIIGRILPRLSQRNDPQRKASELVELMSENLVKGLSGHGIDARRCVSGTPLPTDGWLIRGVFTEIDKGRRIVRATIGFGAGSTSMEVYVTVSDLAKNPDAPFIIFGTEKDPARIPGAVVTMNPYVAAAKFVLEKNASEKDVKKTAAEIADAIVKYMGNLGGKGETGSP